MIHAIQEDDNKLQIKTVFTFYIVDGLPGDAVAVQAYIGFDKAGHQRL
jgi:hypothetical protein